MRKPVCRYAIMPDQYSLVTRKSLGTSADRIERQEFPKKVHFSRRSQLRPLPTKGSVGWAGSPSLDFIINRSLTDPCTSEGPL